MEEQIYNCMMMFTFNGDQRTEKLDKLKIILGDSFKDSLDQSTLVSKINVNVGAILPLLDKFELSDGTEFIMVCYPTNGVIVTQTVKGKGKITEYPAIKKMNKMINF